MYAKSWSINQEMKITTVAVVEWIIVRNTTVAHDAPNKYGESNNGVKLLVN
jgi:hypothetical protein